MNTVMHSLAAAVVVSEQKCRYLVMSALVLGHMIRSLNCFQRTIYKILSVNCLLPVNDVKTFTWFMNCINTFDLLNIRFPLMCFFGTGECF